MVSWSRSDFHRFLVGILLVNYVAVSLIVCLSHSHDPDNRFHDNCPACQWQIQSQEGSGEARAILDALQRLLSFSSIKLYIASFEITHQALLSSHQSRAPPSL